jgi:hypothetical protein
VNPQDIQQAMSDLRNFQASVHRLEMLLDPGYGGIGSRLLELLEALDRSCTDSETVAQRIVRALNLLDQTERQAEAPTNPEDDGA